MLLPSLIFTLVLFGGSLVSSYNDNGMATDATPTPSKTYDLTNGLNRTGDHVCSYEETIQVRVNQTYLTQRFVTVYYKTCSWFSCNVASRMTTRHFVSSHLVTKYVDRDVYYCCSGWKRNIADNTQCDTPICSIKCQNGGKCVGPNQCKCTTGFSGKFCQIDTNECSNKNINNCDQVCTDKPGGFVCSCNTGYTLDKDGKTCNDVNECRGSQSNCGCVVNDGVCKSQCTNTVGSYYCTCPTGYTLNSAELCEDRNECFEDQTLCDHRCVNKPGSYECTCFNGFTYNSKSKKCEDNNECLTNNGGCSNGCININGSYVCTCPKGKYLVDSKTCKDVDLNSKSELFCQTGAIGMLTCDDINAKLNVTSVFYGRLSTKLCPTSNVGKLDCNLPNAMQQLVSCNGQTSCLVMLDMFPDPCPGIEKYATVGYRCEV